uniref:hypothetical protein n=1 Tax=Salmonella sp. s51884 TaxID=3159654 RepID=UPI0039808F26
MKNICFDQRVLNQPTESREPFSTALSAPNSWGVTAGDQLLKQKTEETTAEEIKKLAQHCCPSKHKQIQQSMEVPTL